MTLTFSKPKTQSSPEAKGTKSNTSQSTDIASRIENCVNYHKNGQVENPSADLQNEAYKSVVFKKETQNNYVYYEFWTKVGATPSYYTICVSRLDKQLDSIRDEYEYTVPITALRITDQNELEIVQYDRCRPF